MIEHPNYFDILDLNPEIDDNPTIAKAIEAKRTEWSGNHPTLTQQYYLSLLPSIRATMLDAAARRRQAEIARTAALDKLRLDVTFFKAVGTCQANELKQLYTKYVNRISERIIDQELRTAGVAIPAASKPASTKTAGTVQNASRIAELCATIQRSDLYHFLASARQYVSVEHENSFSSGLSRFSRREELLRASSLLLRVAQDNQLKLDDVESAIIRDLCGKANVIFATDTSQRDYDLWLENRQSLALKDKFDAIDRRGVLSPHAFVALVASAEAVGFKLKDARELINAKATEGGWAYTPKRTWQSTSVMVLSRLGGACLDALRWVVRQERRFWRWSDTARYGRRLFALGNAAVVGTLVLVLLLTGILPGIVNALSDNPVPPQPTTVAGNQGTGSIAPPSEASQEAPASDTDQVAVAPTATASPDRSSEPGQLPSTNESPSIQAVAEVNESPGSQFIVEHILNGQSDLFLYDLATDQLRNLTDTPRFDEKAPDLSPDRNRLAFVSDESGRRQIWSLDLADNSRLQATNYAGDELINDVTWMTEEQLLITTVHSNGTGSVDSQIYKVSIETTPVSKLGTPWIEAISSQPAVVPGYGLAYVVPDPGNLAIVVGDENGKVTRPYLADTDDTVADETQPASNPAGTAIAFCVESTGTRGVSTIRINVIFNWNATRPITRGLSNAGTASSPVWSADGSSLAFVVRSPQGIYGIYTVHLNSKGDGFSTPELVKSLGDDYTSSLVWVQ